MDGGVYFTSIMNGGIVTIGLSDISQAWLRVLPVVLFWLCSWRRVASLLQVGRRKGGSAIPVGMKPVWSHHKGKNCTNNDVVPLKDGEWNRLGISYGSCSKFWAIHVAVLCGAVHRDAVTLVIDKPGEEKKTSCKVAPTSVWVEVFDVKLKLCCRLRAEAQIIWRSNGNSCGHVSKIQVHTAGDLGTRSVDALRLFPTYSYLCFSYMILNVSDHIRESNKFVTHKFQCKILLV